MVALKIIPGGSAYARSRSLENPTPNSKADDILKSREEAIARHQAEGDKSSTLENKINTWFGYNRDNYDPTALAFLKSQWETKGVDPREFVKQHDYKSDIGNGMVGWFNKTGNRAGDDYVLDPTSNKWITRNRATGASSVEGVTNYQQADFELKNIQKKIDALNNENVRIKNDNKAWFMTPSSLDAIKGNEEEVKKLRGRYDAITGQLDAFRIEPIISDYIKGKGIVSNDNQSLALMQKVKELIDYSPVDIPENPNTQDVIDSYLDSLENPYRAATENAMSDLVRRGMLGSGQQQEKIGELTSAYDQAKKQMTGNLTADYFKNKISKAEQDYKDRIDLYLQDLESQYRASGQTAEEWYGKNQAIIGDKLNQLARDYQNNYQDLTTQYNTDWTNFNDTLTATKNLFGEIGQTVPYLFNSQNWNKDTPLSQRGSFYQPNSMYIEPSTNMKNGRQLSEG